MIFIKRAAKKGKSKNAEIQLSFQFIFSLILVAVVLFVGFWAIKSFINRAEQAKLLTAVNDIRTKVNEISNSDGSSYLMSFKLNSAVKYVCFSNISPCSNPSGVPNFCKDISFYRGASYNMFFYPLGGSEKYDVKSAQSIYCGQDNSKSCLDLTKTLCIARNAQGEFKMRIEKPNENSLVIIKAV